jgi:predicted NBD/HSP70 family sugar kinase
MLIRSGQARTRAELIARTGLSRSTVTQRLSELFDLNLIVSVGDAASTGGRPPSFLSFNSRAGAVISVVLGSTHMRVALLDLGGEILAQHVEAHVMSGGPVATLERVAAAVDGLRDDAGIEPHPIWGCGVGLPGPVEFASGRPVSPPIMPGWDGFPVGDWLRDRFSCTVLVDNEVNVMTLGEREQCFPGERDLVCVKVGTGIGAGLIIDGRLYRGAQGSAGDIGHIYVPGHDDVVCECGNTGCLEAVVSGRGLARRLREAGLDTHSSRDVVREAQNGSQIAVQVVREAGRELGLVLAGLVNSINPAVVVLTGAMTAAGDNLLAGAREVVYRRSAPLATRNLRIVTSTSSDKAGIVGAATMTVDALLDRITGAEAQPPSSFATATSRAG